MIPKKISPTIHLNIENSIVPMGQRSVNVLMTRNSCSNVYMSNAAPLKIKYSTNRTIVFRGDIPANPKNVANPINSPMAKKKTDANRKL